CPSAAYARAAPRGRSPDPYAARCYNLCARTFRGRKSAQCPVP
ncbi:MAG: hypothetical protein AVDCRST_MAG68-56, partial [uncultured Gemmatimonadetes bacterium]